MPRADLTFAPRLLPAPQAAAYLGVSETTLRGLDIPRKLLGGKRLYDRLALDEYASSLPSEGEGGSDEVKRCDEAFGT
ncbi:helix-turn-helix domain-containing protein [Paracoccus sp. (in: a-proteobacteria)]|uniref:helix-turn-helix domain-containing protein n=1 Tax=Paracoccus sp. TaxID=267 RepID=UPI00272ADBB1|nr:helix-turn-helix domain-containing protein [Paracoccus sp. (in: a-proteobacteria)]